jgi:four helix bundle protein
MKTHKDLKVWQNSIDFVTVIYSVTKNYPQSEKFGLTNQIRRSAVSIPSNIAEGSARNHNKEFIQFLYIALSSASELDTQLRISLNLEFITTKESNKLLDDLERILKMLQGLIKSAKANN